MPSERTFIRPERLAWTEDPRAQELIATNSVAFVIGFILDQQVRVQMAFAAPLALQERLGHLDAATIAAMPVIDLETAFSTPTPLHRYPKAMAQRVHACMTWLVDHHDGNPDNVWLAARDLADLKRRIQRMPGFGAMKAVTVSSVLAHQFQVDVDGWDTNLPPYGSLAYVDSLDDLTSYQQRKGAYKKAVRAGASPAEAAEAINQIPSNM